MLHQKGLVQKQEKEKKYLNGSQKLIRQLASFVYEINAEALEFYDLMIFMRGPGAQRKKITALFGRMKDPIGF